jgi:hypothetical protein
MSKLREFAKDQPCAVMYPGCRHMNPDPTTVLAHYRSPVLGKAQKEHDIIGAHACHHCHDIADSRKLAPAGWDVIALENHFAEGIFRTQQRVCIEVEAGRIKPEDVFPDHAG